MSGNHAAFVRFGSTAAAPIRAGWIEGWHPKAKPQTVSRTIIREASHALVKAYLEMPREQQRRKRRELMDMRDIVAQYGDGALPLIVDLRHEFRRATPPIPPHSSEIR